MSYNQKIALFELFIISFALISFFILIPFIGLNQAWLALLISIFYIFGKVIFPRPEDFLFDERDKTIERVAFIRSARIVGWLMIITVLLLSIYGSASGNESSDWGVFRLITGIHLMFFLLGRSAFVLILSNRMVPNAEG